jgi:hypothetical protein
VRDEDTKHELALMHFMIQYNNISKTLNTTHITTNTSILHNFINQILRLVNLGSLPTLLPLLTRTSPTPLCATLSSTFTLRSNDSISINGDSTKDTSGGDGDGYLVGSVGLFTA